jgi:ornithine decarboxylase
MAPTATTTIQEYPATLSEYQTFAPITYEASRGLKKPAPAVADLIGNALKARIESINSDDCDAGDEDAFFVADLGAVYRQHLRWKMNLPRVKPHYGT